MKPGTQAQLATHIRPDGSGSEPGSAYNVCVYQSNATCVKARQSGDTTRIQPIGLRGRRDATRAPSAAKVTVMSPKLSARGPLTTPLSGGSRRVP